ncbi:MAG: hypothetical protein LBR35_02165, partial [Rickettsiales bacterium]|nr:hypothetical protein [Rickettsiales bacterium]
MKLDKTSKFIAQNPDVETKSFSEINDILQLFYEKRAKLKELQTKENLRQINEELFVVNADIKGLERLALKNIKDEELVFIVEVLVSKHKAENIGTKKSLIKAEFERFKMEALRRELEIPLTIRPLSSKNFVQKKQISNEDL